MSLESLVQRIYPAVPVRPAMIAAAFMILIGLVSLLTVIGPGNYLYAVDSASYVEQARSLLAGRGLVSRPFSVDAISGLNVGDIEQPDALYPPGYPLVTALASAISGIAVSMAAVWVSRIALAILPVAIFLLFLPLLGVAGAACLGLLGGASPSLVLGGQLAVSDVLSVLFVVAAFALAVKSWASARARKAYGLAFASGALAAFSYTIRNAHAALLVSLALSMAVGLATAGGGGRRRFFWTGMSWACGAALVLVPSFLRNMLVFGRIQPYRMPPSTTGLKTNIHQFIVAQVAELSGSSHLPEILGWRTPLWFVFPVAAVAAAFLYLAIKSWPRQSRLERMACSASILYALVGAAVVIIARTRYHWGEQISMRHAMPYTVFWLLPMIILVRRGVENRVVKFAIAALAVTAWLALRLPVLYGPAVTGDDRNVRLEESVRADHTAQMGPCAQEGRRLTVSNYAYLYRIVCDANAVHPTGIELSGSEMEQRTALQMASWIQLQARGAADVIALHPGRGVIANSMPLPARDAKLLAAQGWKVDENSPLALVIERHAARSD